MVSIEGHLRPYEGVCDTPLPLFDWNHAVTASIEGIIRMDFHLLRSSLLYQTAVYDVKTGGQAFQSGAGSLI